METLAQEISTQQSPSVQYFIFDQHKIIDAYSAGFANVERQIEANTNTTYHAFSLTKTFTALAILQLAEQNKLDIEDPVVNHLPGFYFGSDITIRHLLNHTAGIANPIPISWIHLLEEHANFNRDEYFEPIMAKNRRVKSKPNERFMYSNLGYIVLGQLIEKVSGQAYEEYVEEHIIAKLGLTKEGLGFTIAAPEHHATGYHKKNSFFYLILGLFMDKSKFFDKTEGPWKSLKPFYLNGAPYGGLIGKPMAFVRYIQALLQEDSPLLSESYKALLFRENYTNKQQKTGMCLSWFTSQLQGHQFYTHAGGGPGYYCEMRLYPNLKLGSVLFFNRTGMSDERFLSKLDGKYFGK